MRRFNFRIIMWEPISLEELKIEIQKTETDLKDELLNFWSLIKIEPEKWQEHNMEMKVQDFGL